MKRANIFLTVTALQTDATQAVNSKTQFAQIEDYKIAYRSVGKGEPFILCSRFRGNLDDWDPAFLDALATKYQVITFNYKGLASSTGAPHSNILGFAKDVVDLADVLGFKKIIVGGWSLGGWVAQIVTTEFSERILHTILIGTKPPGKVEYPLEEIFINTAYKPDYTIEDETILFFEPKSKISSEAAIQSHERITERKEKDPKVKPELWEFYGKCHDDYANDPYNSRQKIMSTNIPILVISAHHEVCFPPENWFELNNKLPTTQLIIIPQAGHGPHHQYPKMVADYIDNFIQNIKYDG
ncbi:alpha/beta hydrolase [Flavobacterium granuli]|uniref:Pimeloyl-ACP methyl ester carboxylesterase n=1 Tax=Flavobacterium granuli TaxID=280093 RepID=A0ABU1S689_9FLAO|nr:alpha/beta hydrolase [Flavobacterium granuli]MDR6845720.1 pimeloyl-ACP methyl ester carboxylesterase [Flavobacterium granuli]